MTKVLYLLRHANASRAETPAADMDRPLDERGRQDASLLAAYMKREAVAPALVLCSPARRAMETWELLAPALGGAVPAEMPRSLYLASASRLHATLQGVAAKVERVLLIGHNPGIARLAAGLAEPGTKVEMLEALEQEFSAAAMAELHFEVAGWSGLAAGGGRLAGSVRPRDLQAR
jgi:phosphohistidine phosphatase